MANRRFEQFFYSLIKKPTFIGGVVSLSAAGAVLSSDVPGGTVTKVATGKYRLTLQDKYSAVVSLNCALGENAEDLDAKPGAADVTSAKTIDFHLKAAGVDTDVTATGKLYIQCFLRNSSVS